MICLVDCNWWLWIQTICILSTFSIHIQFTPPKTALKKPVKASSRHEKTDLARFGLPFLQRWVTWAASGMTATASHHLTATSHTQALMSIPYFWGALMVDNFGCRCATQVPCFALFYHVLSFYVWLVLWQNRFETAPLANVIPARAELFESLALKRKRSKSNNYSPNTLQTFVFFKIISCTPLLKCIKSFSDAFASRLVKAHKLPVKERRAKPPREGQGTFGVLARLSWDWCYRDGSAILEQMMHHAHHCIILHLHMIFGYIWILACAVFHLLILIRDGSSAPFTALKPLDSRLQTYFDALNDMWIDWAFDLKTI